MRLFESHVPARLPKALDEFPRDRPSGAAPAVLRQGGSPAKPLSPDPAIGLKEPSQGTSPHLPDSRSLPGPSSWRLTDLDAGRPRSGDPPMRYSRVPS